MKARCRIKKLTTWPGRADLGTEPLRQIRSDTSTLQADVPIEDVGLDTTRVSIAHLPATSDQPLLAPDPVSDPRTLGSH